MRTYGEQNWFRYVKKRERKKRNRLTVYYVSLFFNPPPAHISLLGPLPFLGHRPGKQLIHNPPHPYPPSPPRDLHNVMASFPLFFSRTRAKKFGISRGAAIFESLCTNAGYMSFFVDEVVSHSSFPHADRGRVRR